MHTGCPKKIVFSSHIKPDLVSFLELGRIIPNTSLKTTDFVRPVQVDARKSARNW